MSEYTHSEPIAANLPEGLRDPLSPPEQFLILHDLGYRVIDSTSDNSFVLHRQNNYEGSASAPIAIHSDLRRGLTDQEKGIIGPDYKGQYQTALFRERHPRLFRIGRLVTSFVVTHALLLQNATLRSDKEVERTSVSYSYEKQDIASVVQLSEQLQEGVYAEEFSDSVESRQFDTVKHTAILQELSDRAAQGYGIELIEYTGLVSPEDDKQPGAGIGEESPRNQQLGETRRDSFAEQNMTAIDALGIALPNEIHLLSTKGDIASEENQLAISKESESQGYASVDQYIQDFNDGLITSKLLSGLFPPQRGVEVTYVLAKPGSSELVIIRRVIQTKETVTDTTHLAPQEAFIPQRLIGELLPKNLRSLRPTQAPWQPINRPNRAINSPRKQPRQHNMGGNGTRISLGGEIRAIRGKRPRNQGGNRS